MYWQECSKNEVLRFRPARDRRASLRGFSILELTVALTLFAMALSGLFPLLAEYSRQAQRLEKCSPQCGRWKGTFDPHDDVFDYTKLPNATENQFAYPDQWHLVPADDPWMWKLGAAATLIPEDPDDLVNGTHVPYLRPFPYVNPTPAGLLADDSNPANADYGAYAETVGSAWIIGPASGYGYMDTSRRHATGTTASWAAKWTFKNVQPGWYEVWVTWPDPNIDPPPSPTDNAMANVTYRMLDGAGTQIGNDVQANQNAVLTEPTYGGRAWTPLEWNVNPTYRSMIYIPKRDVVANKLTTADANGHSVSIYNGDTIQMQIYVPATPAGFVTADGMILIPKTPNIIKRPSLNSTTWTYDATHEQPQTTVSTTITVTLKP